MVVGPPVDPLEVTEKELSRMLVGALQRTSVRDAAASVAIATGAPKRRIYALALTLSKDFA